MPSLRNSLNIRSRVMWVRAFFNSYKRRVIAAGGVIQNEPCAVRSLNNNLLRSASWVLVPSGIEEDVVFAQKPTSGLGDLTFTRASDVTYTDAGGVVRRSPYNLVTFSEQFNDASWTKDRVTVTANVTTAPNGTTTADKVVDTLQGNSAYRIYNSATLSAISYSAGFYVKAAEYSWVYIRIGNSLRVWFNVTTGVVGGADSGITGIIENAGNGWYRCTAIITTATAGGGFALLGLTNANNVESYTPTTGGQGVFVWGAQLVEGTSALDYFPTTNRQDVPRIDFRNADGTLSSCGRLLLEPQRTNLVLRSQEFDNASWNKVNTTVTANAEISPDGTQDAETMTVSISDSRVEQTMALTAGTYTFSVYVKIISQTTAGNMRLQGLVDAANVSVNFTPTTEWQRFTATYTAAATLTSVRVRGQSFVGTLAVWGAQLEAGAYATTYIPTTTAAVTRIADAASKTGVSSLIGQTEGTLFVDFVYSAKTGNNRFSISSGSTANWIFIGTPEDASTNKSRFYIRTNNTIQVDVGTTAYFTFGQRYKLALAYKSGSWAVYGNGTLLYSGTHSISAVSSPLSVLNFFQESGQACDATELMNQAALFPTRLTNAQLAQLTTL